MSLRDQFKLRPDLIHLNHGSFGACPKPIFEDYQKWQLALETDPVQFFVKDGQARLKESRDALGKYVGCNGDDLVFTMNPSYAMNIVIKDFNLNEGDEILTTDLEYGAMDRAWNYYCRKAGAKYIRQKISLPVVSKDRIIEEFFAGLTHRTKAIFISEITSTTALILPVNEICEMAKDKGLITIVDGAHVPGHIPLDLQTLKADIYTGACHKWMLTPKGCSFLYAKKDFQPFDPLLVSWGYEADHPSDSQFIDHHQMQGTRDYSAFLTIPKALEFFAENNWRSVSNNCKQLVRTNAERFAEAAGGELLCPVSDEFLGQMCAIRIKCSDPMALHDRLYDEGIEIPVMPHGEEVFLRFSINGYNSQEELDNLFETLEMVRTNTHLLG